MKALMLMAFLCSQLAYSRTPARIAAEIEEAILSDSKEMPKMKAAIDAGVNRALQKAEEALEDEGHEALANQIRNEWEMFYERSLFTTSSRNIGDHPGISKWINDTYRTVELLLGRDFCIKTHIAALLTFNSANVIVKPCTFPMDSVQGTRQDEYKRHFAGHSLTVPDENYNGVVPEATYFACELACIAGTSGIGAVICGMAAGIGEKLMATYIAPKLSDRIFSRRCAGLELGDY